MQPPSPSPAANCDTHLPLAPCRSSKATAQAGTGSADTNFPWKRLVKWLPSATATAQPIRQQGTQSPPGAGSAKAPQSKAAPRGPSRWTPLGRSRYVQGISSPEAATRPQRPGQPGHEAMRPASHTGAEGLRPQLRLDPGRMWSRCSPVCRAGNPGKTQRYDMDGSGDKEAWDAAGGGDVVGGVTRTASRPLYLPDTQGCCVLTVHLKTTMKRPPTTDNPSHKSFRIFTYLSVSL